MTILWCMERNKQNFLSFWTVFCPFTSPKDLENENFEKTRKKPGEIVILHMCTINDNHMIYGSWDINCNRQIFLSSWAIFCLFTHLTARKMEISKKWIKSLEISSLYTSVPKFIIIGYAVPEIWYVTYVIVVFHLGRFFALLPPKEPKGYNSLEISFYMCVP